MATDELTSHTRLRHELSNAIARSLADEISAQLPHLKGRLVTHEQENRRSALEAEKARPKPRSCLRALPLSFTILVQTPNLKARLVGRPRPPSLASKRPIDTIACAA